jgi:hypothetical protein
LVLVRLRLWPLAQRTFGSGGACPIPTASFPVDLRSILEFRLQKHFCSEKRNGDLPSDEHRVSTAQRIRFNFARNSALSTVVGCIRACANSSCYTSGRSRMDCQRRRGHSRAMA